MPTLFEKLPFTQAIKALRNRLAITKEDFLALDAANRSRSFTVARVADQSVLEMIHAEMVKGVEAGEGYREFTLRLQDVAERTGWTGTNPVHQRLIFDMNAQMAHAAGRVQQGEQSGLRVWRYLPSNADVPRVDHEQYYNQLFRMAPGSPVPPIDFNCACTWEWVFDYELEAMGIDPESLPVFDPPPPPSGFVWSPASYVAFKRDEGRGARGEGEWLSAFSVQLSAQSAIRNPQSAIPQSWLDAASNAAGTLFETKFERLAEWINEQGAAGLSLEQIANRIVEALPALRGSADPKANDAVELIHQATLAALLSGRAMEANTLNRRDAKDGENMIASNARTEPDAESELVVCDGGLTPAAPDRILVAPWGTVESSKGQFIIDEPAVAMIVDAFTREGVDVPIDYEHQSLGGQYASPTGQAPAAGWIKRLDVIRPGKDGAASSVRPGVYGQVEWTANGRPKIEGKEYRYVSPVILRNKATHRGMYLHSVALTNRPAIVGMQAIVNKSTPPSDDPASAGGSGASLPEKGKPMKELCELLALKSDAGEAELVGAVKAALTEVTAHKALCEQLAGVAAELGDRGKPLADSLAKGTAEAIGGGLRLMVNALQAPAAEVVALRSELNELKAARAADECEALLTVHSNKVPPAQREWFKKTYAKDPAFAKEWIEQAPEMVANSKTAAAAAANAGQIGGSADRATVIAKAKSAFGSGGLGWGGRTAREYIDGELLAHSMGKLADTEAVSIGV